MRSPCEPALICPARARQEGCGPVEHDRNAATTVVPASRLRARSILVHPAFCWQAACWMQDDSDMLFLDPAQPAALLAA